jgi:hypothetical protein
MTPHISNSDDWGLMVTLTAIMNAGEEVMVFEKVLDK